MDSCKGACVDVDAILSLLRSSSAAAQLATCEKMRERDREKEREEMRNREIEIKRYAM